ncbi:MAG TPA: hybrid sensor histidine kinase/response regulator [Cyanobacteria bacterium UBA11162]|nr:hybrid sensor histidine kinase/response regulator [Cyanobacteria bacterium UBA11162]
MIFAEFFIPHGHCYLWKPQLVGLHLVSDALTGLAYYSIPLMLIYFVQKRRDIPFNSIFLLFSAFIIACGTTHLMEIWTLWHPTYWLSGLMKASTASVSLYTAGALVSLLPKALALPSPAQLEAANQALQKEIRERLETEEALTKSEALYRGVVEDQTELICRYLPDGTLTFVNGAYCRYFGKKRDELIENSLISLIPEQNQEQVCTLINSLLKLTPACPVATSEYPIYVNGEIRWQCWSDRAIFDQQGKIVEFQSVGRDITEVKQTEALKEQNLALATAKIYAESANQAKTKFLANMTHELRTPLHAILGFTQLLSRDPSLMSQQQEKLAIITRSGEHLLELINDILEMSKIESGRTKLHLNPFDLYRLIDSLEEMLELKAKSKGINLQFDLAPDVPQYVQTDESKLRSCLINIVGNAIKFTERGSAILRVKTRKGSEEEKAGTKNQQPTTNNQQQTTIFFEVEDTGPGIAPHELDTLFDAFVQTETGRRTQEGTGLGLAISHKFVELMGGKLKVKSTLNQGTTVSFNIQATQVEAANIQYQLLSKKVIGLALKQPVYRILVVEDRAENRHLLVTLLASLGFEVLEATNGLEGVELWERFSPHLILMDMQMPVMDGYEATQRIKTSLKGQATIVIAITASAFEEERGMVMSAGCDDIVLKPFQESVLLEKISQYLGVSYVYEDSCVMKLRQSSDSVKKLVPEALLVMSPDWVVQLHRAAESCNDEEMLTLIDKIPDSHAPVRLALADLVHNFRFDTIADLTQSSITSCESNLWVEK